MKASALPRQVSAESFSMRLQAAELGTEGRYSHGDDFLNYSLCGDASGNG